ncbi:MAG: hypothetical protein ACKOWF_04260 [Chloroflexota bacterium]
MAIEHIGTHNDIEVLSPEQTRAYFDGECRRFPGISGEEFLRRLAAGEYDKHIDDSRHGDVTYLAVFSDVAQQG